MITFIEMIGSLAIKSLRRLFAGSRKLILNEILGVRGLMKVLMKHRNTGAKWTPEEIAEIRDHVRNISKVVPALIIFLLPGGSLLLPLLAAFLDRRNKRKENRH